MSERDLHDHHDDVDPRDPEFLASLALDGELDHEETLALLDALADDPAARDAWRRHRGTQQLIDDLPNRAVRRRPTPRPRVRGRRWLAAAVVLVAVGLLSIPALRGPAEDRVVDRALSVRLGEAPGSMDDERFVEMAVDLLRADSRYHERMADLLDQVHTTTFVTESAAHERRGARETRIARSDLDTDFDRPDHSAEVVPAAF